jgi:nitrite reductase/ring-hydroxylating ferredoxin subunit
MKKIFPLLIAIIAICGCSDDDVRTRNPFLPVYTVNVEVNLNLPLYNDLNYAGNAVLITQGSAGINGIILFNAGGSFLAWEATCPNQVPTTCSTLDFSEPIATCPCDDVEYSLYTGQPNADLRYGLVQYRTEVNGNVVRIYN